MCNLRFDFDRTLSYQSTMTSLTVNAVEPFNSTRSHVLRKLPNVVGSFSRRQSSKTTGGAFEDWNLFHPA